MNGTKALTLNRDDAAGFRLNTTFTHKQHASFSTVDEPEKTTRSDYLNKHTSILQVSSYMFMSTETTKEVCGGVVKAHNLFDKIPAQHAADLQMLEEKSEFQLVFRNKQVKSMFVLMEVLMKLPCIKKCSFIGLKGILSRETQALF